MALQSHPKHLERLFDRLCINKRLKVQVLDCLRHLCHYLLGCVSRNSSDRRGPQTPAALQTMWLYFRILW